MSNTTEFTPSPEALSLFVAEALYGDRPVKMHEVRSVARALPGCKGNGSKTQVLMNISTWATDRKFEQFRKLPVYAALSDSVVRSAALNALSKSIAEARS